MYTSNIRKLFINYLFIIDIFPSLCADKSRELIDVRHWWMIRMNLERQTGWKSHQRNPNWKKGAKCFVQSVGGGRRTSLRLRQMQTRRSPKQKQSFGLWKSTTGMKWKQRPHKFMAFRLKKTNKSINHEQRDSSASLNRARKRDPREKEVEKHTSLPIQN